MKKRTHWPPWLVRIERLIDRSIPFMLILLTVLIVLEFTHVVEEYHDIIVTIDGIIIGFFVIDLIFKWFHVRKLVPFVKLYWIDILAVFPFYTLFRLYAFATEVILAGEQTQKFLHEAVLLRETKLIREMEFAAKFSREARMIRIIARSLRLLRARWYIGLFHLYHISKKHANASK